MDYDSSDANSVPSDISTSDSERELERESREESLKSQGFSSESEAGERKKPFNGADEMSPFNLKDELEEGDFDESGFFVRSKRNGDSLDDRWLEGISAEGIKAAKQAQERLKAQSREKQRLQGDKDAQSAQISNQYAILLSHLKPGEKLADILAQLNSRLEKLHKCTGYEPIWKKKLRDRKAARLKRAPSKSICEGELSKSAEETEVILKTINELTDAASAVMEAVNVNIYSLSFEQIRASLVQSRYIPATWQFRDPLVLASPANYGTAEEPLWEYKWTIDEKAVYGPYKSSEIMAWSKAGFFDNNGEGILLRRFSAGSVADAKKDFVLLKSLHNLTQYLASNKSLPKSQQYNSSGI